MSNVSIVTLGSCIVGAVTLLGCAGDESTGAGLPEMGDPGGSASAGYAGTPGYAGGVNQYPQGGAPSGTGGYTGFPGGAQGTGGYVATGSGGAAPFGSGGFTPQGSGGSFGDGGAIGGDGGAPGAGGGGPIDDNRPPCLKKPSQVISMGDSYMNWGTHTFPADLNAAAGVTFRPTYAVGGFSMGSGGIGLIPPQFDQAFAADKDIIAIVLDGGGNDVLIPALGRPDCKNMANAGSVAGCQQIVTDALAASDKLMTHVQQIAPTVHDVIYFFYPHVPEPTALGGSHPNAMLDYALPLVKAFCDGVGVKTGGKANCWFVDTVPLFAGHADYFAAGDIHENNAGSKVIAKAVVDVMKQHCIAQPESSGCCKP